jgi:nucleoside-diphosphate-sugar epimerase/predicted dehydrogenase
MGTVDRPVNVGLLGTGYIADWHAKALRSVHGTRLAAVCDRDTARVQAFAARHGAARFHTSLSAMLSEGGLDVIHVLLPPELHAQTAAEVIDAGLHVLLEKPMATSVFACANLIEQARSKRVKIGVSHNFLFAPIYEKLKADVKAGRLGRPDEITVTWNKGLDQLQTGPFDLWMFREPQNIMLEVGSHSVAHMLDLVGPAELTAVHATNPLDLPGGARFFRRWHIEAGQPHTGVTLNFSFASGFSEHSIHIRGSLASATADFERNTYVLHRHTPFGLDFDRHQMVVSEASAFKRQARHTFAQVALEKLRPSLGNPYGQSIARALQSFYAHLADLTDARLSPELGRDVIRTCVEIGPSAGVEASRLTPPASLACSTPNTVALEAKACPQILILGATGFIGQELARQLIASAHSIRVLVRNPSRLPPELRNGAVDIVVGDLSRNTDLAAALTGIRCVYHLARSHVKTWEEYAEHEVEATGRVAEAALAAKVERLIYTGTIDSYYAGAKAGTITENTPLDPHIDRRNYYARAKALSEQNLMSLHRQRGLPVVIFRPGIVIGQGGSPLHWGIGMWSWNAVCQVWGEGHNPLPLVLVEDVAQALVSALDVAGIMGESFNLVADSRLSALDYLDALEECTGSEFQKTPTPPWKFYVVDVMKWIVKRAIRHSDRRRPSYRDWETRTQRAHYDCSKARKLLNWNPTGAQAEIIRRGIQLPAQKQLA